MEKTIFLCEDSPEGIFTGIYDAWASRKGHSKVKLKLNNEDTLEMFSEYVNVVPDAEKAEKVRRSVCQKICAEAWIRVFRAAMSEAETKADDIYRFLVGGFYYGPKVLKMLAEPAVMRIMELDRKVGNEAHYWKEFLRFDERENGILFARIHPKSNVISMITPHFADRLSGENFMILDTGRGIAAIHPAGQPWYMTTVPLEEVEHLLKVKPDEYRDLWKSFYRAITIEARLNPDLQRNRMPLWYREYMTEFLDE